MRYVVREKFFHLGQDSAITNEAGQTIYIADGKVFTLHNTVVLKDTQGDELATISRQLVALTLTYHITSQGQEAAVVHKKLFSPFVERYVVEVPGSDDLTIQGTLLDHNFTIERAGQPIANVSKRWVSLTNTYGVDIAQNQDDILILAIVIALDMAQDHEAHTAEAEVQ